MITHYRIVKSPGGVFFLESIEDCTGSGWRFVTQSASSSLDEVRGKLEVVMKCGEPHDEVIETISVAPTITIASNQYMEGDSCDVRTK